MEEKEHILIRKIFPLLGLVALFVMILACTTDSDSSETITENSSTGNTVANVDEHGLDEMHEEDEHVTLSDDEHQDEHTEAADHPHGDAEVDHDAPVMHWYAHEFGYDSEAFEVHEGEAFTIMLHNTGALEHDIVIEGHEQDGGIHLLPGEDGKATFTMDEHGEYHVYCTVPGHRDAGMESILVVNSAHD